MNIAQYKLAKPMIVGRGRSRRVFFKTAAPDAVARRKLPPTVRWSFLLFISSLAFEVGVFEEVSLPKLTGFLFFAIYFFYHNPLASKRSFPPIPRVMWWFIIYVTIYALHGLWVPSKYSGEFVTRLFTLVQSLVCLWLLTDILEDEKMAHKALLAYSIASVIVALGLVLSIPGFGVSGEIGIERATVTGASGHSLALAMLMLLGLWLSLAQKRLTVLMLVSVLAISTAIVYTGGRMAFLMSIIGISVYLVPYWKHRWRISGVIIGIMAIGGLAYMAFTTPVFSERWRAFSEKGNTSGRDIIFAEAFDMISERPLVGWQPVQFEYELGRRTHTNDTRAAHNLYLHLLMEVGMIGAVPFLIGLWLCGWGAWKARNRPLGLLPLALLVATLASGIGSNTIKFKWLWLVLAVTVAVRLEKKRPSMILMGRPIDNGIPTSSWKLNSPVSGRESGLASQQRSFPTRQS